MIYCITVWINNDEERIHANFCGVEYQLFLLDRKTFADFAEYRIHIAQCRIQSNECRDSECKLCNLDPLREAFKSVKSFEFCYSLHSEFCKIYSALCKSDLS